MSPMMHTNEEKKKMVPNNSTFTCVHVNGFSAQNVNQRAGKTDISQITIA